LKELKRFRKAYPNFQYDSPFVTLKDNFHTLNFNWYDVGPRGESPKVQSIVLAEMKGGDTREKIMGGHEATHPNGQTIKEVIVVQKETQQLFAQIELTMYATTISLSINKVCYNNCHSDNIPK
jgi:hypothetical protein